MVEIVATDVTSQIEHNVAADREILLGTEDLPISAAAIDACLADEPLPIQPHETYDFRLNPLKTRTCRVL
jgi:hypothetical protein